MDPSTARRGRPSARRDLVVMATALVALFIGASTGAFAQIHSWMDRLNEGTTDAVFGVLLVGSLAATAIALLRRQESRREASLRTETEARFQAMVEQVPAVAYTWDTTLPTGQAPPVYVSPQLESMLGYSPQEWSDHPERWLEVMHPEDRERVRLASDEADRTATPFHAEYRAFTKDGRMVWIRDDSVVVARDDKGGALRAQGVMYDITRQKEAEERLQEAENRYRTIVERVPAVAYVYDSGHRPGTAPAGYISPQIERLLGFTSEEWIQDPMKWESQLHTDDVARVLRCWTEAVESGSTFVSEYRIRSASGSQVWVRDEAVPVADGSAGHPIYQGVMYDITDRTEAEERLRAAEERYRSLVEQLPAVVYVDAVDDIATAQYISPQYERLTGYSPQQRLADPEMWVNMLHEDDRQAILAESDRTNLTGDPFDVEYRIVRADGATRWVRDQAFLIEGVDGAEVWQGVLTDITDRKLAEARLEETEARYRGLIETIPAVTYIDSVDALSDALYTSPQIEEVFGYTVEQWTGDTSLWERGLHPEDRDEVIAKVERLNTDGEPYHAEYRFVRRDGRIVWVSDHAVVLRDEQGTPRFSQGVFFDITARKEAEEQLRGAEERYRAIVEHVPAAIYLDQADRSMRSVYISPQIEEITGISAAEWIADPEIWLKVVPAEEREQVERSYIEAITSDHPWQAEYRMQTRDGRMIWVHDETTILHDADGNPTFLQGVLMDVTERKLAEQALRDSEQREREAAERLRALDDMKNTFLAAVSHELRSPLTSILGLSITLERSPEMDGEDRQDLLSRLSINARKLDKLLKDLLDIDRLNRGIVAPQYRTVDVGALARRTVESMDAVADRTVIVDASPVVLSVDPPKVERIVENLVMNAVRHTTADRTIWLTVAARDAGVLLTVEDDGPGVPVELREEIFEPFRQGPSASAHSPGTGIGLSLVSRFASLHEGAAWVEDRPGGGASFQVFLPDGPHVDEGAAPETASVQQG